MEWITLICFQCLISLSYVKGVTVQRSWQVVFKAVSGVDRSAYDLYTSNETSQTDNADALKLDTTVQDHYKSDVINGLHSSNIDFNLIKLSIYKDGVQRAFFIFNATGSGKTNWFSITRLINTSYTDLDNSMTFKNDQGEYFSFTGLENLKRRFYINSRFAGCGSDEGWFLIGEYGTGGLCNYEKAIRPVILFCPNNNKCITQTEAETADFMMISIYRTTQCCCRETKTYTEEEIEKFIETIKKELTVDVKQTSAYKRTKISVYDDRPTARGLGVIGILTFALVIGTIIMMDLDRIIKSVKQLYDLLQQNLFHYSNNKLIPKDSKEK